MRSFRLASSIWLRTEQVTAIRLGEFCSQELETKGPEIFYHAFELGGKANDVDERMALFP